jgi:hypothetical protein
LLELQADVVALEEELARRDGEIAALKIKIVLF